MKKFSKILLMSLTILSFLLGLSIISKDEKQTSALPEVSTYATQPGTGNGTVGDPYQIRNADHLAWFSQWVNAGNGATYTNAKLMDNIDLSTRIWTPIGTSTNYYRGIFDGNGFIIKNMLIDTTINKSEIGLFGVLGTGAVVKDFVLENAFIQTGAANVAPIAGYLGGENITLKNIAVSGGQINFVGTGGFIGGIVGRIVQPGTNNLTIANSYSNISIMTPTVASSHNIGGIYAYKTVQASVNHFVYNVYYTGQITTTSSATVDGIGNGRGNVTIRNAYYSFLLINHSGTTQNKSGIIRYNANSEESISEQDLKGLSIYTYFNNQLPNAVILPPSIPNFPAESNKSIPLIAQENWIKNEGEFPQLRGVGNKVVAIKLAGETADYNFSTDISKYRMYQDLKTNALISTKVLVKEDDMTLDEYKLYRKTSISDILQSGRNENRIKNKEYTLSTQPGIRQGYYVFEITIIRMLHEQQIVLKDLANYSVNINNQGGEQISDNLRGKLSFYNESGELFVGTTENNRGTSYANTWAEINYIDTPVKIFTTNATELTVHAVALGDTNQVLSYYHSVFLHYKTVTGETNYYSGAGFITNSNHRIKVAGMQEGNVAKLTVCMSDIYALSFNTLTLFDDEVNTTFWKNYGGNAYSAPPQTLYISRKDGSLFKLQQTGGNSGTYIKQDNKEIYPVPSSKGYNFDGWFAENYRLSSRDQNYFLTNTPAVQELIRTLMRTNSVPGIFHNKEYYTPESLTLEGRWKPSENTVQYKSILNLYDVDADNADDYNKFWSGLNEPWTADKANDILGNYLDVPSDPKTVNMTLTVKDRFGLNPVLYTVDSGTLSGEKAVKTTSQITIRANTSGPGYNLRAIIILSLGDAGEILNSAMLKTSPGTFAEDFSLDNAEWYKNYVFDKDNMPEETLYHVHGDLIIYAIYDRGIGKITAQVNVNVPDSVKETVKSNTGDIQTGFSLAYDIYEIGYSSDSEPIYGGTIGQSDLHYDEENDNVYFTIAGLKAGRTIKIRNMIIGDAFVFVDANSNEPLTRIQSIDSKNLDEDNNPYHIPVSYANQIWTISDIIPAETAALLVDKTIYFQMGIRYKGLSIAVRASDSVSDPANNIISNEDFSILPQKTKGSGPQQVNYAESIENLQENSVLILRMDNIRRWVPSLDSATGRYKIVVTNESGQILAVHNLTLNSTSDTYEFALSNFRGNFVEGKKYIVYIIVEEQLYKVRITKSGETTKVAASDYDSGNEFVFDGNNATMIVGVTYDQLNKLKFETIKGYHISDFKVYGTKPISFVSGVESYLYEFAISGLQVDYNQIKNQNNIIEITIKIEAKKTDYKIEYYKENLTNPNIFDLADTEEVQNAVSVGENKTITPSSSKYTGFERIDHADQVLTATIIYREGNTMTVFKVYYGRKQYTVSYLGNGHTGGTVPSEQIVKYGYSFTVSQNTTTKTGFEFVSWNTKSNNTGSSYLAGSSVTMNELFTTTAITPLYAIWKEKTLQITYLSQNPSTNFSSSWKDITGYTTFSNQRYAISIVTYSKAYGFVGGMTYSTLPAPSATGYNFAGWWTTSDEGGEQISAGSAVAVTENTTLYARWTRQNVKIEYDANIAGVSLSLSFNTKMLYVGSKYSDIDVVTLLNAGFPSDSWTSTKVLNLKGWSLELNPSGTISYLTEQSIIPAGQSTIKVYAHWEVLAPTIVTKSDWSSNITYNQNLQKTLEITNGSGITYISNASGIFTYSYEWFKSGVVVSGQTASQLNLKDVAQSGQYTVKVSATHAKWGTSTQTQSGVGTVIIDPMHLTLNAPKTGGFITKVYDDAVTVKNVTTSNSEIIRASAVYDNENAGNNKQITFTLNYVGSHNPNNYAVSYESVPINNPTNATTITHIVDSGQITKYALTLTMGNLSNIANGTKYRIESTALTISAQDLLFLGSKGQSLSGYILTADAVAGVYSTLGTGLISYLTVKNTTNQDKTGNYEITVSGQFEIVEGVLKTLVISKKAILDKDNQTVQSINTAKFIIRYLTNDISTSRVYNIAGNYFNVVNENNSDEIIISTNAEFSGSVLVSAVGFNHTVASLTTVAVAYRWIEESKSDIIATNIEYNFSSVTEGVVRNVTIEYVNFSTIHYFTRFSPSEHSTKTVYNTQSGLEIPHVSSSEVALPGLEFLGWFDSTGAGAVQIPTLWKGYGNVNVYAKWNVLAPQVSLFDDETAITNSITKTYDAIDHKINLVVDNAFVVDNTISKMSYKYSWKVNSQEKSTTDFYSYKNATTQTITLTVRAELYFNGVLYQSNTTTKTITLTISKFSFTYSDLIEKVYDGTVGIKVAGQNYIIVPITIGTKTEQLKLTGQYSVKYAGNDIAMSNMEFSDYPPYSKENYDLIITSRGKITPRTLIDVNIGVANDNQKVYNGTSLQISKTAVASAYLVGGDLLDITFKTNTPDSKIYDAQNGEIEIVSWAVFDSTRTLNITSSYTLESIIGSAKITNHEIIMQDIVFENASVVYNGSERYIYATFNTFAGGIVPADVLITYTWVKNGTIDSHTYPIGPSEAGLYTVTMTLTADETNYTVIGANSKTAELTITKKALTIYIQNNAFYGQGIKTVAITNDMTSGLALGHTISGNIQTNSNLPAIYSQTGLNLVLNLSVKDLSEQEKISNYSPVVSGSITIVHYYYIEYNANGGTNAMLRQQVDYNEEVFLSSNLFNKDGYNYSHWNTLSDGTGTTYAERAVVKDMANHGQTVTMYAMWTPANNTPYYVYHYLQNLDLTYPEMQNEISTLTSTTENYIVFEPVYTNDKIDYYLVNTYKNSMLVSSLPFYKAFTGFTPIVHETSVLNGTVNPESQGALIIKIYYQRNSYEATFNKNNFDVPSIIKITYLYEQTVPKPANPQRLGWDFWGWFIGFGTADETLVTFSEEYPFIMPANNVQFVAKHVAHNNTAFNIELYEQDVNGAYSAVPASVITQSSTTEAHAFIDVVVDGGKITQAVLKVFDTLARTNQIGSDFTFEVARKGFYLAEHENQVLYGIIAGDGTMKLKLYFAREIYSFTKDFHNSVSDTISYHYYLEEIIQPVTPVYIGYIFDGWYSGYNESTGYSAQITWPVNIVENMTAHAKWLPSKNTQYKVNIFFETLAGTYPAQPSETRTYTSTTNYHAEIINEVYLGKMSNVLVIFDETKVTRTGIETVFNYTGYHINSGMSELSSDILPDGSGEINIYFERDLYTVTFVYNNGDDDTYSPLVKYEQTINKPDPAPEYTGYVFAEWYLDSSFTTPANWPYKVLNNTTAMYAKWNNATNTAYRIETYKQDETGNYPVTPQTEIFDGTTGNYIVVMQDYVIDTYIWYLKEYTDSSKTTLVGIIRSIEITGYTYNQNDEIIEKEIAPDGTMVIRLYYTLNSYTFTFEPNNGNESAYQSVFFNSKPIMEANPLYTGFVFAGWYEDIALQTPFAIESFSMPAHNVTVYAKWTPAKDTAFKVEYYLQNLDLSYAETPYDTSAFTGTTHHYVSVSDTQIVIYETSAKTLIIKAEGLKNFIGFTKTSHASQMLEGTIDRFGNLVLKVYLQRNSYWVIFNYNSGQAEKQISDILYENTVTESIPQRAGYTFAGWYYESTLNTKVAWQTDVVLETMSYIMEAKNVEMFAKWSANSNTKFFVQHYLQNANNNDYTLNETKEYEGITDTTANAQKMTYLGFVYDELNAGNILSGNIAGNGSLVLKVYYNRAVYKLIFNGNGSSSGVMSEINFRYGQVQSLPAGTFLRTGYTFKGWTDIEGGIVVKYSNQATFTFLKTQDINLYALWQLNAMDTAELNLIGKNTIYYGDEIELQVDAVHQANVTYTYEWYFNGQKTTHSQQNLKINALAQSGTYKVLIFAQGVVSQGAQNNLTSRMTNEQTLTVSPRPVQIDFGTTSFIYNAQNQNPAYEINFYVNEDEEITLPSLSIVKPSSTFVLYYDGVQIANSKNAGTYQIIVTLDQDENFVLAGSMQSDYEIEKLAWDISEFILAGEFSKNYAYPASADPVLEKAIKNPYTNEEVIVRFTREAGEGVGLYDLILTNETLENPNYEIFMGEDNDGFAIKKVLGGVATLSFISTALLSKVYDGQVINASADGFVLSNLALSMNATLLSAAFAIKNNSKNAGTYEIVLVSATSVEYENIEMQSQYYYIIRQRSVEYVSGTISKVYDRTTTYNDLQMTNIIADDLGSLTLKGAFSTPMAGNNIPLGVTLDGNAKSNYKLGDSFIGLYGTILPRQIKIISDTDEVFEYGSFDGIISYRAFGFNDETGLYDIDVDMSQITGLLGFDPQKEKFTAGVYETTEGTISTTSNYQIAVFEKGTVEIIKKAVSAVADWNKYFDGLITFNKPIQIIGVLGEDEVWAIATYQSALIGQLIEINLTLAGTDSENYFLDNPVVFGNIEYKYVTALLDYGFDGLSAPNHSAVAETVLQLIYNKTIKESGYVALPTPWATGYNFAGWFDEFDNKFDENTLISDLNWSESQQIKALSAKWTIGTVDLTVGVITYSSTSYTIEQMNLTEIASGSFSIDGVDYLTGGNIKAVSFGQTALLSALPASAYEFAGWYLSASVNAPAISNDEMFTVSENNLSVLMNNNMTIYAKFRLKTAIITLYANAPTTSANISGEYLDWEIVWSGMGFVSVHKQFDFNTVLTLPLPAQMTRTGYNFIGWADRADGEAEYTELTLSQDTELYAVWQSKAYTATFVASTGADESGLLHADRGHFTNPTYPENDGIWEKEVFFEQSIGAISQPLRARYTFAGWYDNSALQGLPVTENTIYSSDANLTYYAKWIQNTYTITLTVEKYKGGQVRVEQSDGVLNILIQTIGTRQIITVQLLANATIKIYADTEKGYELAYNHGYVAGSDFEENIVLSGKETFIDVSRFNQNLSLNITFKSLLQEITFTVPSSQFGTITADVENLLDSTLRAEMINDAERVSVTADGQKQIVVVYAYTDEQISVNILSGLGYELYGLIVTGGDGGFGVLSGNNTKFTGFNEDCSANIEFTESTHTITLRVGKDVTNNENNTRMGSFALGITDKLGNTRSVDDNIENDTIIINAQIKTGEKLVINANAFHGFVLSQNPDDYVFIKQNHAYADGIFSLDEIGNGIIEFSAFNCGGEIYLPYLRDLFSLQFKVAIVENGIYTEITENISNHIETQVITDYDAYEDETEYYYFEKVLTIKAIMNYGYIFVGWFNQLDAEEMFSNNKTYTDYRITNNMTVYAVIELDTFVISYSYIGKGHLSGESLVQEVRYLAGGQSVTAVADEGYEFSHWEIYNNVTSQWETDTENTDNERTEITVTADMSIRAVFIASGIEITFNSLYIIGKDAQNNYIFSDEMSEDIGTMQIFDGTENGFEFNYITETGNTVRVSATAHEGFSIVAWMISEGSKAYYISNDGLKDISIKGFTADFTMTAIFDSNINVFKIAFVKPVGDDYNYNSSQFINGGVITIDPTLYLQTQPYQSRIEAAVRTKQAFEVVFQIAKGYILKLEEGKAKIGIKFANQSDIVFADNITVSTLFGGYNYEVIFMMENFYKGGEIVLFLEEETFNVTFYKTSTEYRIYELKIGSTFATVEADYKHPSRVGYIFEGWFSGQNGQGTEYINSNGITIREWQIEHTTLYAHWSRAYVTYTLQFAPSLYVADGPLGWNVQPNELKRIVNVTTFEYFVGITTYFQAPAGLDGYIFSHWEKDGIVLTTNRTYVFDIAEDESVFAQTLQIVYKVRYTVNATVGGTATISGQNYIYLLSGETAMLQASPRPGYDFAGWKVQGSGTILSTELNYEISYSGQATVYTAVFEGKLVEVIIVSTPNGTVTNWKVNGGSPIVEGNKYYARLDDMLTFTTIPLTGYILTGWEINGITASKFDYYEIRLTDVERASITFKPVFNLIDISYEIIFASSGEVRINNQNITSGRTFVTNYYSTVTFAFNATIRYTFKQITVNGIVLDNQYIALNGYVYTVNIPAANLSLTNVNRIQLSFDRLLWQDSKIPFDGLGTAQNPYIIASAENFAQMAFLINNGIAPDSDDKIEYESAYYVMFASVDFIERFWTPIGTQENPFNGVIRLDYERRNIFLDATYTVIHYEGLFGYITENAQFLKEQPDITTGVIIFSSVGAVLIVIVVLFSVKTYQKRKRLREQSRIFPTERPIKKG